jgi:hypothetical protein
MCGTPKMIADFMANFATSNSSFWRSFPSIEESLNKHFFPALAGKVDISEGSRELLALPVKIAGIAIPNPITSAETNYKESTLLCSHLIRALLRS